MSGSAAHSEYVEAAFNGAREAGASVEKAAKAIGKSRSTGDRIVKKVKQLSLTEPRAVNSAVRSLKKIASGKAVNGIEPNAQTIVAACKEFTDRAEPKVNMNQNLNINVNIDPVNLDAYKD